MSSSEEFPGVRPGKPASGAAAWFGEMPQDEFEIDFFEQVARRSPNYVQVLRCLGELLARKGHYDRSVSVDRKLVDLVPDDCVARYNLACSLAMIRRPNEAIDELRRAIEQGYSDFGYLEVDSDLDALRNEPGFRTLLREYGIGRDSNPRE